MTDSITEGVGLGRGWEGLNTGFVTNLTIKTKAKAKKILIETGQKEKED